MYATFAYFSQRLKILQRHKVIFVLNSSFWGQNFKHIRWLDIGGEKKKPKTRWISKFIWKLFQFSWTDEPFKNCHSHHYSLPTDNFLSLFATLLNTIFLCGTFLLYQGNTWSTYLLNQGIKTLKWPQLDKEKSSKLPDQQSKTQTLMRVFMMVIQV